MVVRFEDTRVATLIRPLDRTLVAAKFTFVPAVAAILSLIAVTPLLDAGATGIVNVLIGIVAPAVAVLYLLLLRGEAVSKRVDKILAQVSRWVALTCNHDYASTHQEGSIACRMTPESLQAPLFDYLRQEALVEELVRSCEDGSDPGYWFVEGEGGSGKTRAALMLVQALVRHERLCGLGIRCHLYDFGEGAERQHQLLNRLGSPSQTGAVILIDNFQLVEEEVLSELTTRLVSSRAPRQARLVVIFARPQETWNLGPGVDVRLLSEAKAKGRHELLPGPLAETVTARIRQVDEAAARSIAALGPNRASAVQLHLAQVIVANKGVPVEIDELLELIAGADGAGANPSLMPVLAAVAALSVHRGSFSIEELRAGLKTVPLGGSQMSEGLERLFDRLHAIRFVSKDHRDADRFVLHEDVAALCIDRLSRLEQFRAPLETVGRMRLRNERRRNEQVTAWLLAAEIDDYDSMIETFQAALAKGATRRMKKCLKRAMSRGDLAPAVRLQLAILYDRVGDFVLSRDLFADEEVRALGTESEFAELLTVSRIEVSHFADYENDLTFLLGSQDPVVRLIGEYWEVHIGMHEGVFDSDRLLDLATDALGRLNGHSPFWKIHSLARMHFDSLRCFYLSGRSDAQSIESDPRRDLDDFLRENFPLFEAMRILYKQAHLVGHVLVPRLALLGEEVDPDDLSRAGVDLPDEPTLEVLTRQMLTLYRRAQDEFWQYGDREATYLKADILNAAMVQPDADLDGEDIAKELKRYEKWIVDSEFNSLNSYPHFYWLRWNVLRRHQALTREGDHVAADRYLVEAERHLARIGALDAAAHNKLGLLRANLFGVLLAGFEGDLDSDKLTRLRDQANQLGYGFERDLATRLLERPVLSPAELVQIFRFYPFVHQ